MSASRLAEATGLSAAATTSMIDRLERKGFVRRRKHETDRRQVLVEMTEDGQARTWAIVRPAGRSRACRSWPVRHRRARGDARPPHRDPRAHRRRARAYARPTSPTAGTRRCTIARDGSLHLLDLLDEAVAAYGDKTALSLRLDDGSTTTGPTASSTAAPARGMATARARARAGRPAADLVAVDARAARRPTSGRCGPASMLVPLDLRMSPDAIEGDRRGVGRAPPVLGHRPRRARSARGGPRRASRRRPSTRSPPTPTPTLPGRLGGAARRRGRAPAPTTSSSSSSPRARPARPRA